MKLTTAEEKGKLVLEVRGDDITKYSVPDLDALLSWYQIPKQNKMVRKDKERKWDSIRQQQPPMFEQWTDDDKNELKEACRTDLEIGDTALGRLEKKRKRDLVQTATKMTEDEWNEVIAARSLSTLATMPETTTNLDEDDVII